MSTALDTSRQSQLTAGQATYGMSNLRQDTTGLPFIVFISQRDDARHAARVKWSRRPKVRADKMGAYAIDPFGYKAGPRLDTKDERQLEAWVALNRAVLQGYWDGAIDFTQDAIAQLRNVQQP